MKMFFATEKDGTPPAKAAGVPSFQTVKNFLYDVGTGAIPAGS